MPRSHHRARRPGAWDPSYGTHGRKRRAVVGTAHTAIREGAQALIAYWGDGTPHLALQAIAETDVPLGLIQSEPVTTTHERCVCRGRIRLPPWMSSRMGTRCKLIVATWRSLTERRGTSWESCPSASTQVNERANAMTWPHGQARYLTATVAELRVFKPVPFEITLDGTTVDQSAMLVAVGNGISYGGGMKVMPDAVQDDGMPRYDCPGAVSKLKFLKFHSPSVFRGTHVNEPFVVQHRFRIKINAPGRWRIRRWERIGPVPVTVSVKPGAVHVYAPTNA